MYNIHDVQDGLGPQNSMLDVRQHQETSVVSVYSRDVTRPHLQPDQHQTSHQYNTVTSDTLVYRTVGVIHVP